MSKTVKAFGVTAPTEPHTELSIDLPALGDNDVELKVLACGICHSDLSLARAEWGPFSAFPQPQIGGHEVIGEVVALGKDVKGLKVGDRCGVGWYKSSCLETRCESCMGGHEQICPSSIPTCAAGNRGGFAEAIRINADFALPIPEGLPSEAAAPLLCGGITVYSPLVEYNAVAKRVGVLGIGGLGSMAVQLAKARGNTVTVLSTSPSKEELAKSLGADTFIDISRLQKEEEYRKQFEDTIDILIYTANQPVDYNTAIFPLIKRNGALVMVGAVLEPITVPIFGPLIMKQIKVTGSATGGRARILDMLRLARDHKVYPQVEVFPFSAEGINTAIQKMDKNQLRFRAVLKW